MKRLTIAVSVTALALGGVALAAPESGGMAAATMTRAQMQAQSAQMFDRLDGNKDGKIDQADREARRAAMFDSIDSDHNGQISRAEFTAGKPGMGGRWRGGADNSGQPDGQHMGRGGRGHGMGGHGMGRMMMRMADSNRDGAISREEFSASAAQRFDRMDANKDGQVTPEERRAMRQQHMQERGAHHGQNHEMHGMDGSAAPAPGN